MTKKYFTTRKFDGDSAGSWAIFRKHEVKGIRGVVFYGEARPIYCGLTKREADRECAFMEAEEAAKNAKNA